MPPGLTYESVHCVSYWLLCHCHCSTPGLVSWSLCADDIICLQAMLLFALPKSPTSELLWIIFLRLKPTQALCSLTLPFEPIPATTGYQKETVFTSWRCNNKWPQPEWLRVTDGVSLMVLEARSPKPWCRRDHAPSEGGREKRSVPGLSLGFSWFADSLIIPWLVDTLPISAYIFTCCFPCTLVSVSKLLLF